MEFLKTWTQTTDKDKITQNDQPDQNTQNDLKTCEAVANESYVTSTGLEIPRQPVLLRGGGGSQTSLSKHSDGSDYVLESDHSDSPSHQLAAIRADTRQLVPIPQTNQATAEYYSQYAQNIPGVYLAPLKKTGSTGDLRMYNKTDLKNKINTIEHRLLMLEKRFESIEKYILKQEGGRHEPDKHVQPSQPEQKQSSGMPSIIKIAVLSMILVQLGRYI